MPSPAQKPPSSVGDPSLLAPEEATSLVTGHESPHFDEDTGACMCEWPCCSAAPDICICPECNSDCGCTHPNVPRPNLDIGRRSSVISGVVRMRNVVRTMDATLDAIYNLDPEAHATKSRDYGRGFAEALRIVRAEIDTRMGDWAERDGAAIPDRQFPDPPNYDWTDVFEEDS